MPRKQELYWSEHNIKASPSSGKLKARENQQVSYSGKNEGWQLKSTRQNKDSNTKIDKSEKKMSNQIRKNFHGYDILIQKKIVTVDNVSCLIIMLYGYAL